MLTRGHERTVGGDTTGLSGLRPKLRSLDYEIWPLVAEGENHVLFRMSGSWESGRWTEDRETADGGRESDKALEEGTLGTPGLAQHDLCAGRLHRARRRRRGDGRGRRARRRRPAAQESGSCGTEVSGVGSSPGRPTSSCAHGLRRPCQESPWPLRPQLAVPRSDRAACAGLAGSQAQRWAGGPPRPRGGGGARSPAACSGPAPGVRAAWFPGLQKRGRALGTRAQAWD